MISNELKRQFLMYVNNVLNNGALTSKNPLDQNGIINGFWAKFYLEVIDVNDLIDNIADEGEGEVLDLIDGVRMEELDDYLKDNYYSYEDVFKLGLDSNYFSKNDCYFRDNGNGLVSFDDLAEEARDELLNIAKELDTNDLECDNYGIIELINQNNNCYDYFDNLLQYLVIKYERTSTNKNGDKIFNYSILAHAINNYLDIETALFTDDADTLERFADCELNNKEVQR